MTTLDRSKISLLPKVTAIPSRPFASTPPTSPIVSKSSRHPRLGICASRSSGKRSCCSLSRSAARSGRTGPIVTKCTRSLESYDLVEQRHEVILSEVHDFSVARDGSTLVVRDAKGLRADGPRQETA